jgi:hypothetical protein
MFQFFLNQLINFCFNVEALSARIAATSCSTSLQMSTHMGFDWWRLNSAPSVSDLKDVLGPYQHTEALARYAAGLRQAGPAEYYLIQVLARGDEMIEHGMRLPPLARDGRAMQPSRVRCRRIISNSRFSHYREDGLRPNIREVFSSYKMFGAGR